MADKINILEIDINTSALITKMTDTRAEIDKLKLAQKDLTNNNQSNSDSFTKNAVEISKLQSSYTAQKNVVSQLSTASKAYSTATDAATQAVAKENLTIADARANNTQLLALRNQVNTKTVEGQAAITAINAKLDENNKHIKDNVSGYEQQKIGIGDYKTAITGALNDTGLFGGSLQSVSKVMGNFSGIFSTMKTEVKAGSEQMKNSAVQTEGMTLAQKGLSIATNMGTGAMRIFTMALAATGIGLIIIAVALLIGYFKTFDPLVDKIEQGMAGLGAVVRTLQIAVVNLFSSFENLGNAILHPLDSLKKLGDKMNTAASAAANLKAAQQDLEDAQKSQEVTNNRAKQMYDELILKSKNRTLTEKERIAFLQQAQKIEEDNFKQNQALANAQLKQAIENARINGELSNQELANLKKNTIAYGQYLKNKGAITDDDLKKLIDAENKITEVKAESTKLLEKNQNSQDKLNDDAAAKKEKAIQAGIDAEQKATELKNKQVDIAIQKSKDEIALYIAQQGIKKQSIADELTTAEVVMNKKLALLKTEIDAGKITKTAGEVEALNLKNEFAKKQADVTVANANTELQTYLDLHKSKLDANKFLNDELYQQELERLRLIGEAEATAAKASFDAGITNKTQYDSAIAQIDATTATNKQAIDDTKAQADKDKKAIDLENQRTLDAENFTSKFDLDTANEQLRYTNELAAADKNGADKTLIVAKHTNNQKKIDEALQESKMAAAGATFGLVSDLLGKETVAGKAAALAQALINTYLGITAGVKLGYPMAIPAVAMATLTGFGAVKNIIATRAEGGLIPTLQSGVINNGGNVIPLSNGDDTLAYVGQGELILNKQQQQAAGGSMFFKSLGVPGFNGGGIVGGNANITSTGNYSIDLDLLASKMAQANRSLPAPVVSVTDIAYQQNRVAVIEAGANF
jgi:hypothetical protein